MINKIVKIMQKIIRKIMQKDKMRNKMRDKMRNDVTMKFEIYEIENDKENSGKI